MFNWKVGQKVKVVGNKTIFTDDIDGEICEIIKLRDDYAVVQENCPAKYQWYVPYEDLIPINSAGEEVDYDWMELGDLDAV